MFNLFGSNCNDGCNSGGGCSWIIILIIIFCVCGGGNIFGGNKCC